MIPTVARRCPRRASVHVTARSPGDAQAWHWVDPVRGAHQAAAARTIVGRWVAMWSREDDPALTEVLTDVDSRVAPHLVAERRDARDRESELVGLVTAGLTASTAFEHVERHEVSWTHSPSALTGPFGETARRPDRSISRRSQTLPGALTGGRVDAFRWGRPSQALRRGKCSAPARRPAGREHRRVRCRHRADGVAAPRGARVSGVPSIGGSLPQRVWSRTIASRRRARRWPLSQSRRKRGNLRHRTTAGRSGAAVPSSRRDVSLRYPRRRGSRCARCRRRQGARPRRRVGPGSPSG